jgi:hypothetical protein
MGISWIGINPLADFRGRIAIKKITKYIQKAI